MRSYAWFSLMIMGLLTVGTYWLLQNTLPYPMQVISDAKLHIPDYFADHFSLSILNKSGITQYRIAAASMIHYEDDPETYALLLAIRAFTPGQPIVTATGKRARINDNGLILDLYNDARIVREASQTDPLIQADSQHFCVLIHDKIIKTEKPVKLLHGSLKMKANGMIYDNVIREIRLLAQVHGVLPTTSSPASRKPRQLMTDTFFSHDIHQPNS
ncbi:LPS export ABC transporter periplasmic protein LptC [Candidatus Vallotia tarda]|uniref:LPS export ABC transporter periplasmic protein LptC n=1 Tax=Candidatus Vallotiella hemipterorum TaxID=1177213 RepID=A0A916NK84_9BURK|nr:LPS export ABC transporter periplasmic protein LptC [Candidatus Vallotia tarda]CAG7596804.1 LPS export ABC transporter periplasmic protein LptC [Candidatus Vallotia tarda]